MIHCLLVFALLSAAAFAEVRPLAQEHSAIGTSPTIECFAELVCAGATPRESRHYASMCIDGGDLCIVSPSDDARAHSAHNLITFHRVQRFRDLVY